MAVITRKDGERFVIPSYRDVITVKTGAALKKEILALSSSYGEYITLQVISPFQYEVAFSTETGYLLGESIWNYFKRPQDMVYCEAIPDSTDVILVIVKNGSVYLDGSFSVESVPDELVIFLTQENHFNIYIYGNVPISETEEEGKFHFEATSVKSFTVLDKPAFAAVPLVKAYQLQLVNQVLEARGIGVFPIKSLAMLIVVIGLVWAGWSYFSQQKETSMPVLVTEDPYRLYNQALMSPAPNMVMTALTQKMPLLLAMPGWKPTKLNYQDGKVTITAISDGSNIQTLKDWADRNDVSASFTAKGVVLTLNLPLVNRTKPTKIYALQDVLISLADRMALVYPGNHMQIGEIADAGVYKKSDIDIGIDAMSPATLALVGETCNSLPIVLSKMALTVDDLGLISGTMTIEAVGN